jgi:hypothetical protein
MNVYEVTLTKKVTEVIIVKSGNVNEAMAAAIGDSKTRGGTDFAVSNVKQIKK